MQEFQELYQKYNQYIFRFILKLTSYNRDLAEELTQETFFQAYLSLPGYRGNSSIQTWLCSIAKNVCFKYFKKNPIGVSLSELEQERLKAAGFPAMEELTEQRELLRCAVDAIMAQKETYRDVLVYRLFFELSFREIGSLMGIKEGSAKVLYHRGKAAIREKLEDFLDE